MDSFEKSTEEDSDREIIKQCEPKDSFIVCNYKFKITETLLVLVTAILAFYTYGLWASTENLVKDEKAAVETQLRAYLSVNDARITELNTTDPLRVILSVKNTGQTPAKDMVHLATMMLKRFPYDGPFNVDEKLPATKMGLAPGDESTKEIVLGILNAEQVSELETGKRAIWVYGEIRYADVFGKKHFTKYRMIWGGYGAVHTTQLTGTPEGNESN